MIGPDTTSGAQMCAPETDGADSKAPERGTLATGDSEQKHARRKSVSLDELPPPGVTRWVIRRKAQVVAAVQSGTISLEEVCQRYSVSVEEFESWQTSLRLHGLYGLRTTRSQIYRARDDGNRGDGDR